MTLKERITDDMKNAMRAGGLPTTVSFRWGLTTAYGAPFHVPSLT